MYSKVRALVGEVKWWWPGVRAEGLGMVVVVVVVMIQDKGWLL